MHRLPRSGWIGASGYHSRSASSGRTGSCRRQLKIRIRREQHFVSVPGHGPPWDCRRAVSPRKSRWKRWRRVPARVDATLRDGSKIALVRFCRAAGPLGYIPNILVGVSGLNRRKRCRGWGLGGLGEAWVHVLVVLTSHRGLCLRSRASTGRNVSSSCAARYVQRGRHCRRASARPLVPFLPRRNVGPIS